MGSGIGARPGPPSRPGMRRKPVGPVARPPPGHPCWVGCRKRRRLVRPTGSTDIKRGCAIGGCSASSRSRNTPARQSSAAVTISTWLPQFADRAADAEIVGQQPDERPEADALDAAADQPALGRARRLLHRPDLPAAHSPTRSDRRPRPTPCTVQPAFAACMRGHTACIAGAISGPSRPVRSRSPAASRRPAGAPRPVCR